MTSRSSGTPEDLTSWHAKIRVYGQFVKSMNPTWDTPDHIVSQADELLAERDASTLRAQAKETDVWVRETLTTEQQDQVVKLMLTSGVRAEHLPRTTSRAKLRRLISRGALKSESEVNLVRSALDAPEQFQLSPQEIAALGAMFDRSSSKPA